MPVDPGIASASLCAGRSCAGSLQPAAFFSAFFDAGHGHASSSGHEDTGLVNTHDSESSAHRHGPGAAEAELRGHRHHHDDAFLERGSPLSEGEVAAFLPASPGGVLDSRTDATDFLDVGRASDQILDRQRQLTVASGISGSTVAASMGLFSRMVYRIMEGNKETKQGAEEDISEDEIDASSEDGPETPQELNSQTQTVQRLHAGGLDIGNIDLDDLPPNVEVVQVRMAPGTWSESSECSESAESSVDGPNTYEEMAERAMAEWRRYREAAGLPLDEQALFLRREVDSEVVSTEDGNAPLEDCLETDEEQNVEGWDAGHSNLDVDYLPENFEVAQVTRESGCRSGSGMGE